MARKVIGFIKLHVPGGQANPAPPVGPALGQHGVNIMEFCKQFNSKTQQQPGVTIPVEITVYADRSFTFITKTPPASFLIKKAAGVQKASGELDGQWINKAEGHMEMGRSRRWLIRLITSWIACVLSDSAAGDFLMACQPCTATKQSLKNCWSGLGGPLVPL